MNEPFKIGIAGLGTVGAGVVKILQNHADLITKRAGRTIELVAVCARDQKKDRGVDLSQCEWVDTPTDLAAIDGLDAVVEVIGGAEGAAKDLVEAALDKGVSVVTANKALLACHGFDLAGHAEQGGAALYYEAAVAGGIPVIKDLREGFAGNGITGVYGILNGTCNYILTTMQETGRDFADVLKEAQDLGYAEADPAFDIEGNDTAHKLALLTALAFGVKPDLDHLPMKGISHLTAEDIAYAEELGYRIKLLGIARQVDGKILQMVEPCLVTAGHPMADVSDAFNAVCIEGDAIDRGMAVGRGAGEGPTASAVVADLIDLARGHHVPMFGIHSAQMKDAQWMDADEMYRGFYVRLTVRDQPGVLADISAIMRDHNVSMEVVLQRGHDTGGPVAVTIKTHKTRRADIMAALEKLAGIDSVVEAPTCLRMEGF
jgi:homoserine dehydrogenase